MESNYIVLVDENGTPYLAHHGIKGQKWGVRRYQNPDGTWTDAGKARYDDSGMRSIRGNANRLLAKNYDLNARFYDKLGNKALASMNRSAKTSALKRAEAADAAKVARKKQKVNKKVDKYQSKVDEFNQRMLSARAKNRDKLVSKNKSADKIKDFDEGTKYVKLGQSKINKTIDEYRSAKLKVLEDRAYKKSAQYKEAVKAYNRLAGNTLGANLLGHTLIEGANEYNNK